MPQAARKQTPARTTKPRTTKPRSTKRFRSISLKDIGPDPRNVRDDWENQEIISLAASIQALDGLIQPVVVRKNEGDGPPWVIVAGERRYRAALKAGRSHVDCIVRTCDSIASIEIMLAENLHRKNLTPIQIAYGVRWLMRSRKAGGGGFKAEQVAKRFGKKKNWAYSMRRLLDLPPELQESIKRGKLKVASAKLLFSFLNDTEFMQRVMADMEANPWAWETHAQFKRSLGILAAKPEDDAPAVPQPRKRAEPAPAVRPTPQDKTAATPTATPEQTATDADGDSDLTDEICRMIAGLETADELAIVQAALDRRGDYIANASGKHARAKVTK